MPDGTVAIASFVIDGCFRLGEIMVKEKYSGGYFLSYPQRGRAVKRTDVPRFSSYYSINLMREVKEYVFNPLDKETSKYIEQLIFAKL